MPFKKKAQPPENEGPFSYPAETPADIARRMRSVAHMEGKGIPYLLQLPLAALESEAQLRAPEEIARRLLAMFGTCVYSEVRSGGGSWDDAQKYLRKTNEILGGGLDDALSPKEKAYLAEKEPEPQTVINFGWHYECCHVLLWALGGFDDLGWPGGVCDVSRMGKIIWNLVSLADLLACAKPRSQTEVLNMADIVLRYDWACVDARVNRRETPAGLDGGVVMEWHRAFNWLIGAYEGAAWDDVSTDT